MCEMKKNPLLGIKNSFHSLINKLDTAEERIHFDLQTDTEKLFEMKQKRKK